MWDALKTTALIGTDKKPFSLDVLPEAIRESLGEMPALSEEDKLLHASAMAFYYLEAGTPPQQYPGKLELEVVEETGQTAPQEVLRLLPVIEEADYNLMSYLLGQWLNLLLEKSWIVTPDMVLKLVKLSGQAHKETKQKVMQAIGARGRWVLTFKPAEDGQLVQQNLGDVWEEGNTAQRKRHLEQMLADDIPKAIALLESTWEGEAIVTKKSFLTMLSRNPHDCMQPFAQRLYEQEFAWKNKEKRTEKECRRLAADILLQIPTSQLYQETTTHLTQYFSKRKRAGAIGFLADAQQIYALPEAPDDFWNQEYLLHTYGLDTQYDIGLFANDSLYWLSYFLEYIDSHWWAAQFKKGPSEFGSYFLGDNAYKTKVSGKKVQIYLAALVGNTNRFGDEGLAAFLIDSNNNDIATAIAPHLSLPKYEAYMAKESLLLNYQMLESGPEGPWSVKFSQLVIEKAFEQIKQNNYYVVQHLGAAVAKKINLEVSPLLEKYHEKASTLSYYNSWEKHFYSPIRTAIDLKNIINQHK